MATIGPLIKLYEEDYINYQGFRDACRSPTLPKEQRRFLGLQFLRFFNEEVTEQAISAFLEPSDVPWVPPAPIAELTPEEKRSLIGEIMEVLGAGIGQILYQLLFEVDEGEED